MDTAITQQKVLAIVLAIAGIGTLLYMVSPPIGALLVLFAGMLLMIEYPLLALTLVVLTVPFLGAVVDLSTVEWARQTPLRIINAPIGDIIALGALIATVFHILLYQKGTAVVALVQRQRWPLFWFALFVGVGLVSALGAYEGDVGSSLKYLVRAILFSIGIYYFITQLWITNRAALSWVLQITAWVGLASAFFGLGSLVIAPVAGFPRITAYVLRGVAPFGYNHNVLAEFLVVVIPAALYCAKMSQDRDVARVYRIIAAMVTVVALGTFSRAAWLVIAMYGVMYVGYFREDIGVWIRKHVFSLFGVVVLGVIGGLFVLFLQTDVVTSSNQNRLLATDIVSYYSVRAPLLGYGPGMYTRLLDQTYAYTVDFGASLDAHGMIQKVLLEMGHVGVLVWVCLLISILTGLYKRTHALSGERRYLGVLLYSMACSAFLYQLFNTSYFTAHMWWPIGIAMAGIHVLKQEQSLYGNFIKE